jgi:nucleoside-diphosphate-sugar epimerase
MNDFLARLGVPPVSRRVSLSTATRLGAAMEWIWRTFKLAGEPRMTRFLASALARSHWYDMVPASRDLGYRIRVSMAEGADRTVAWFRERDRKGPHGGP